MRQQYLSVPAWTLFLNIIFCLNANCVLAQNTLLDPPHDSVRCTDECHDMTAFDLPNLIPNPDHEPQNIDDTLYNTTVCWKCHSGDDPDIPYAETHSSLQNDNDFGNWTVECVVCHNQHTQEQDDAFGTTYGKFIRKRIDLSQILDNAPPDGVTVTGKNGLKQIKFTGNTGPNSFADGDATFDGICEVCHDHPSHYKNDGTGTDQNHAYIAKLAEKNPNLVTRENCTFCHNHQDGFRPSCPDCHGLPPIQDTHSGPDGLAGPDNIRPGARYPAPAATGSGTSGQHALHAASSGYNYPCHTCHYGGMSMTMTADDPMADNQIQIGFSVEVDDFASIPNYGIVSIDNDGDTDTRCWGCYMQQDIDPDPAVRTWVDMTDANGDKIDCCGIQETATGTIYPSETMYQDFIEANLSRSSIDGSGTMYSGQALAGYSFQGVNGTSIDPGNTLVCSNVYCHDDGKYLANPSGFPADQDSLKWDGTSPDPQGDGNKCNNCHDYPPINDSHYRHSTLVGLTCYTCHAKVVAADGVTIIDETLHANGSFNVDNSPTFFAHNKDNSNRFKYIPKLEGGWCSSIQCHRYWTFTNPKKWAHRTILSTFGHTESCSGGGAVNVTVTNTGGSAPYECVFDWGDGSPVTGWGPCSLSHDYGVRDTYTITWKARDAEGIPTATPNPRTETIDVCNEPPVPQFEVIDGGNTCYDMILYDRSTDNDFDIPNHSGPGEIKIHWGNWYDGINGATDQGITQAVSDITATDPGTSRSHRFLSYNSGYRDIYIAVKDNTGKWVCSDRKTYIVGSTSVTLYSTGTVNTSNCNALVNATPNYPSPADVNYHFNSNGRAEYWIKNAQLTNFNITNGFLSTSTTGTDPYMTNSCVDLLGADNPTVYINMRTSCGTEGQFFWGTTAENFYSEDKSVKFTLPSDGNFHEHVLDLAAHPKWAGQTITRLRLDPGYVAGCTVEIDYIQGDDPF